MKRKFYTVLVTVALGLSSHAMALTFTDGNFTGGVDIGGDIAVPIATNHWQWASGDAISFPPSQVTQMTSDFKTLTLSATSDLPLLVGQTKAATVGNAGNAGLNPQIAFTDAAGNTVTPEWDNAGGNGTGTITLPVTASDGTTNLGVMIMKVKVGALRAQQLTDGSKQTYLDTVYSTTNPELFGSAALPSQAAGILATYAQAAAWTVLIGSKTEIELREQLNAASGLAVTAWSGGTRQPAQAFFRPDYYYAGAYGLGLAQGDKIIVNFTNPVTINTEWKSAIKATVTYL